MNAALHAPHRPLRPRGATERFLVRLFDTLWARYRARVEHVRRYEEMVRAHGATFVNDHIAFRTIAWEDPPAGIFRVSRVFEALGYRPAACYEFPDKNLASIHYAHDHPKFPKLFVTQLKTWELSSAARRVIAKSLRAHRPPLSDETLAALSSLGRLDAAARGRLLTRLAAHFRLLPWPLPRERDVLRLDEESQFGAWVLVNGYDVNHFTASVDSHGVGALDDIEKTVASMRREGIPLKKEIEGAPGSKLRQSSTEAVTVPVAVLRGGRRATIPWTYAYFEIAERPRLSNPATGRKERFQGFLGGQATNLFEMTKTAR